MKIISTIIPTDLVTNSLLSIFCSFLETKNKNQVFNRLVVCQREIFMFFYLYSEVPSPLNSCLIQ